VERTSNASPSSANLSPRRRGDRPILHGWRCRAWLLQRRCRCSAAAAIVTAPELSLFSRCLARQAAEILEVTGGDILELGAGLGLAADVCWNCGARLLPARYRISK
jgi:hypothetical protein